MEHMATKSTAKPMSAYTAAQQRSIVSYHLPSDFASEAPVCIYIEEARNLLAAHGTTGLRVWDASLHLAYFLCTEGTSLVRDKAVLELGAGTGLLSILCAGLLQAARVVSTDGDADVVESIESNTRLNLRLREPGQKYTLEAKVLDWADASSLPQVLEYEGQEAPIDLVLGADITYAAESLEPLVNVLSALHDEYPRVDILISTVIRNEDTFTAFVHTCAKAGFRIKRIPFNCPALDQQRGFFHRTTPPIRIVRLIRDLAALSEEVD
jgi:predicted nicotinamide N-methyase